MQIKVFMTGGYKGYTCGVEKLPFKYVDKKTIDYKSRIPFTLYQLTNFFRGVLYKWDLADHWVIQTKGY